LGIDFKGLQNLLVDDWITMAAVVSKDGKSRYLRPKTKTQAVQATVWHTFCNTQSTSTPGSSRERLSSILIEQGKGDAMLVLTRKANEEILIGDDIKITLVRIRGNSVRIGIEAPREVRVVRGELVDRDSEVDTELEYELGERETVFAHPPEQIGRHPNVSADRISSDSPATESLGHRAVATDEQPRIFVGRVRRASEDGRLPRAPLAGFVSAT
jgi:carbon storage regulator CsrA